MNKENLKDLLNVNRKTLQYLHWFKGMDFEKPFEVISGEGHFTSNSLKKAVNVDNINDYKFSLLLLNSCSSEELYTVDIDDNFTFNKFVSTEKNYLSLYEDFEMFHFYSYYFFEETRKSDEVKWFVVFQKKEYIIPDERLVRKPDFTERFDADSEGHYFKLINGSYFRNYSERCFDKSDYYLMNIYKNYEERITKLRQERAKNEADNYDGLSEAYEMKKKIDELLPLITEILNNKDFDKVSKIFDRYDDFSFNKMYKHINDHIEKLENKSYQNIDEIKTTIDLINKIYISIKNIIDAIK